MYAITKAFFQLLQERKSTICLPFISVGERMILSKTIIGRLGISGQDFYSVSSSNTRDDQGKIRIPRERKLICVIGFIYPASWDRVS